MGYRTIHTLVCLSFFIWTGISCSSSRSSSNVDYNRYRTYAYGTAMATDSEDPVFSWLQLSSRIKNEIDFTLPSIGLDYAPENPDLLIYYYSISKDEENRPVLPYRLGWHAEPFITAGENLDEYPTNTLVLDFVDSNLNELVWRGSTSIPLGSEEETYRNLSERIRLLIRTYPYPSKNNQAESQ